jgi:hypothetical protein
MEQQMIRPMTEEEEKRYKARNPREKIAIERIWNIRPDGFAIKMPTTEKVGEYVILEFKRMSCDRGIRHTGKERCGSPVCVHKIGIRAYTWPRMVGEPEKLHSRTNMQIS